MGEAKLKREFAAAWCERMAERFGRVVHDAKGGREYTWREALRREAHASAAAIKSFGLEVTTALEVECAKAWEAGFWPHWARRP